MSIDIMNRIIDNLNESVESNKLDENKTCLNCNSSFVLENKNESLCPVCGESIGEKVKDSSDEKLNNVLEKYIANINDGNIDEANNLLEKSEAKLIVCEDNDLMLEKIVKVVDSSGNVTKKKVRTKKMKRTAKQKAALRKARKMAQKPSSIKKRKKAMKMRRRKGLGESIKDTRTKQITEALNSFLQDEGIITVRKKDILNVITESYTLNENSKKPDSKKISKELEKVLSSKGLNVLETGIEEDDGVLILSVVVRDCDDEVNLEEVVEELSTKINMDVDYDDPEEDEEDETLYLIDFYVINEEEEIDESIQYKSIENSNSNSSVNLSNVSEAYVGGSENIKCKINPSFIKEGQVIFDANKNTVFEALTDSTVNNKGSIELKAKIVNSANSELAVMKEGASVEIPSKANCYLLKTSPLS